MVFLSFLWAFLSVVFLSTNKRYGDLTFCYPNFFQHSVQIGWDLGQNYIIYSWQKIIYSNSCGNFLDPKDILWLKYITFIKILCQTFAPHHMILRNDWTGKKWKFHLVYKSCHKKYISRNGVWSLKTVILVIIGKDVFINAAET